MIRVLHIFHSMGNGGIEHFVMDRYRIIDRNKIQFDFLLTSPQEGYFDEEIFKLGGKIYHTANFSRNPLLSFLQTYKIVRENRYDIIHRHTGNAIAYVDLLAAKLGGAKHLIIHSHNNSAEKLFLHNVSKKIFKLDCNRLACSVSAGKWLFGNKDFKVINNAIDTSKYKFNPKYREKYRKLYNISENDFVIGHIGRFDYQKNHKFLIDIFSEVIKIKPNSKLVCIGDGGLKEDVIKQIKELGISDKVLLLGQIDNVDEILNCFDVFCLPSRYEGLPISLIEAQTNGLKCFASKDRVTIESNITSNIVYIPLYKNPQEWATIICNTNYNRDTDSINKVIEAGYDLKENVKEIERYYLGFKND